jgi:hypothetical protein
VSKNKKRSSRQSWSSAHDQHLDDDRGWRGGISTVLDLIEHEDQDDRSNVYGTNNAQAGPSSFKYPDTIPSPYIKPSTPSTSNTPYTFTAPQIPHLRPPNKPETADTRAYMDADGFSDLLIGSDRQAEMMADPYVPYLNFANGQGIPSAILSQCVSYFHFDADHAKADVQQR